MQTPEQRKALSEKQLKQLGLTPISLPVLARPAKIHTAADTAARVLALTAIQKAVNGDERPPIVAALKKLNVWASATEYEKFVLAEGDDDASETALSWQTEALWALLWTLNRVPMTQLPSIFADLQKCREVLVDNNSNLKGNLLEKPALRAEAEILDARDWYYRLYAVAEDAAKQKQALPSNLNADIIAERHHAFQWLCGDLERWDT